MFEGFDMATANETVKKVLDHLNQKISSVGGVVDSWSDGKETGGENIQTAALSKAEWIPLQQPENERFRFTKRSLRQMSAF